MQQLFRLLIFFSGNKVVYPQELFFTVYTAFGTMHRHCCRPVPRHRWAAVSAHCTKSCLYEE